MQKLTLLVSALFLSAFFTACSSSSSSEESLAEKCAEGISAKCLTGAASWNLNALYSDNVGTVLSPLSSPTQLVFSKDSFTVTYSLDKRIDGDNLGIGGEIDEGTWTLENGVLTLQFSNISNTPNVSQKKTFSQLSLINFPDGNVGLVLGINTSAIHITASSPFIEIYTGIEK